MTPPVKTQHVVVVGLTTTTYWGSKGGMWWSKKSKKTPKTSPETLEERLDALEGSFRGLKAEWLDTYDKLYRLAGRLDAGRRWEGAKVEVATPATPDNGGLVQTEGLPQPTVQTAPPPTVKMTRSELLRSLTG